MSVFYEQINDDDDEKVNPNFRGLEDIEDLPLKFKY